MSVTSNLKLNISTYGITSGVIWTANHEANWDLIDGIVSRVLVYDGEMLTYDGDLLVNYIDV